MVRPFWKLTAVLLIMFLVASSCRLMEQTVRQAPEAPAIPSPAAPGEIVASPPVAATNTPEAAPTPTSSESPTEPDPALSPADTPGAEWTILLYQDADDEQLEQDILIDLNEAERVGSSDEVQIIAQIDRHGGAYTGDGDWSSARRYYVTLDDDLNALASDELQDLGEVDSSSPQSLADFIAWGIQNYPAQKYALLMSDHGGGWTGGWSDPAPVPEAAMQLVEIRDGIAQGLESAGVEKLELLGFDACLMAQFEVFAAVYPYAHYGLASEEVIPAIGLAYTAWLSELTADPGMDGRRLSEVIMRTYIDQDSRILDDLQRRELFGTGSAEQVAGEVAYETTLSVIDLEKFPAVLSAVDSLSAALVQVDQQQVAEARTYALSYYNIFGEDTPPSFLDLGHFAALAASQTGSPQVASAAEAVETALRQTVVAERHGNGRSGSTGLSIFFPNSSVYSNWLEDYTYTTGDFSETSGWDDFLSFHYYETPYNPVQGEVVAPQPGAIITAPGAGEIALLPIEISTDSLTTDESVTLTSQVSGDNIAYVYTFVGYYDEVSGAVLVADMNFIETETSREVNGVYYPDFSGGPVDLEWEWTPALFNLNDGSSNGFALFEPDDYGAPGELPTYAVYGIWHYGDGSADTEAMVYFIDGEMQYAYAFSGENGTGTPSQITPTEGDQFTVLYTIYTQDIDQQVSTSYQEGDTFTLGESWFTWEEIPAPAGSYVVGFIAMDFDGNLYYQVAPVEVR